MINIVKNNELGTVVAEGVTLVDFYADWCGPCKMIAPVLEQLATELPANASIAKVNVDENRALASAYQVMSVPTLILFKDGQPLEQAQGFIPKEALENWIKSKL